MALVLLGAWALYLVVVHVLLLLGPGVGVEHLRARGGALSVTGAARTANGKKTGTIRIALGPLSVDVNVGKDGGGIGGGPQ